MTTWYTTLRRDDLGRYIRSMKTYLTGKRLMDMNAAQVHDLYKLRVDIFVHEQQCPYAEIDDIDPHPGTLHILAYQHTGEKLRLVGTCRVFGAPHDQWVGRVCVSPDQRGEGLGHQLIERALDVCKERAAGIDPEHPAQVRLNAQERLEEFYQSHGFARCGDNFDEDGIPHVPMTLALQ